MHFTIEHKTESVYLYKYGFFLLKIKEEKPELSKTKQP